jgi:hypothetical protein
MYYTVYVMDAFWLDWTCTVLLWADATAVGTSTKKTYKTWPCPRQTKYKRQKL